MDKVIAQRITSLGLTDDVLMELAAMPKDALVKAVEAKIELARHATEVNLTNIAHDRAELETNPHVEARLVIDMNRYHDNCIFLDGLVARWKSYQDHQAAKV